MERTLDVERGGSSDYQECLLDEDKGASSGRAHQTRRQLCAGVVGLGIVGTLLVLGIVGGRLQHPFGEPSWGPSPMTTLPRATVPQPATLGPPLVVPPDTGSSSPFFPPKPNWGPSPVMTLPRATAPQPVKVGPPLVPPDTGSSSPFFPPKPNWGTGIDIAAFAAPAGIPHLTPGPG